MVLKLEAVKKWDFSRPETLKYYPKDSNGIFQRISSFNAVRRGSLKSIPEKLAYLKQKRKYFKAMFQEGI